MCGNAYLLNWMYVRSMKMASEPPPTVFPHFEVDGEDFPPQPLAPTAVPVLQDHSPTRHLYCQRTELSDVKLTGDMVLKAPSTTAKLATLRAYDHGTNNSSDSTGSNSENGSVLLLGLDGSSNDGYSNGFGDGTKNVPKTWTSDDMESALGALKNHNMSLTKASALYGIPSTTLWQRAHRLGIDTPKKEGPNKSWTEENLHNALEALRTGTISANKASKAYGIPSSTLYKIARREGIRLAAPFNAAPTTWTPDDLEKALESIRSGQTSVQKASTEFGIPTGTLYGRCKREGIELSRSNPTPWSEDAMGEALEAVRLGHMSINQAAIHYNLPYSSLYGRFKRGIRYELDPNPDLLGDTPPPSSSSSGSTTTTTTSDNTFHISEFITGDLHTEVHFKSEPKDS